MKYIKLYEAFILNNNSSFDDEDIDDEVEKTLRDICLELEDLGYNIIINVEVGINSLVINNGLGFDSPTMDWEDIKEYLLRVKDYLGNKYIGFSCFTLKSYWDVTELNEKTQLKYLKSVAIEYRNKRI